MGSLLLLLSWCCSFAQEFQVPIYKVPVELVTVRAAVRDRAGIPVLDLTADDFKIYEDANPQPIHTFALEFRESPSEVSSPVSEALPAGSMAEVTDHSPPHRISLVLDETSSWTGEPYTAMMRAVTEFVERGLTPGDQVAMLSGSGHVLYPFSDDKPQLIWQTREFFRQINPGRLPSSCPTLTDHQARSIAAFQGELSVTGDIEVRASAPLEVAVKETMYCANVDKPKLAENIVRSVARAQSSEATHRTYILLQTLRRHIRILRRFDSAKTIILISPGFLSQELVYDLQDVIEQALRAGVVLNTLDPSGLETQALSVAERPYVPIDMISAKQWLFEQDRQSKEQPLYQLAHDTGGLYYHNSNDLFSGLMSISRRQAFHYVLTYASPSVRRGGYHTIRLEVSRPGLQLDYRKGYHAPKEELSFERRRKEDILEAMSAPADINQIPIELSYNISRLADLHYDVGVTTRVDVRHIGFIEEDSRQRNDITLVLVALDEGDRYVDGLVKSVHLNLSPPRYAELRQGGLASTVKLQLPPGTYRIKAVVRESVRSEVGSLTRLLTIP
jgi:VWFA-related protein